MAKRTTAAKKTTTTRRTTSKTTTPRAKAPAKVATPVEASADAPPAAPEKVLGKRDLIDRVVTASGIKKSAAKPVIEAMLRELGDALSNGETLNLQPFGKGIIKNRKELENAEVIELRLRRSKLAMKAADTPSPDPLANAAE